jgi:hypothetical protein
VKKSKITQNSLPVPCSLAPTTIFNAHLLIHCKNHVKTTSTTQIFPFHE